MITEIKNNDFQAVEKEKLAVVDFNATWCGPCQMMNPVIADIANEMQGKLKVGKVNVDEQEALAAEYKVMSIPTFILFKDGKPAAQAIGGKGKDDLLKALGV